MTRSFLFLFLFLMVASPPNCLADLGSKPHFEIFFDESVPAEAKPKLFTCENSACEDQIPFKEFGPQRFDCSSPQVMKSHSCYALAYGFSPFLKLRVQIKDKEYESEPFAPDGDLNGTLKNGKLLLSKRHWWE